MQKSSKTLCFIAFFLLAIPLIMAQVMVKDVNPANNSSDPQEFTQLGTYIYFTADDGVHGRELWKTAGTGATMVKDINAIWTGTQGTESSDPYGLVVMGGYLYFFAYDGVYQANCLWRANATTCTLVSYLSNPTRSQVPQEKPAKPTWKQAQKAPRTNPVKNAHRNHRSIRQTTSRAGYDMVVTSDNTLYFRHANGLWKSDGTAAGTTLVKQFTQNVYYLTAVDACVYFTCDNDSNGQSELWRSNGTAAGTNNYLYSGNADVLTRVGSALYFQGTLNSVEYWLCVVPTTSSGSYNLCNSSGELKAREMIAVGDTLYFAGENIGTTYTELYRSNGNVFNTVLIKKINPGAVSSGVYGLCAVKNATGTYTVFFAADDGTNGSELWKTDGTPEGTTLVKDIVSGSGNSGPDYLTAAGTTLFFSAYDGVNGRELWKSDGTTAGTVMVKDIYEGGSSDPDNFKDCGGELYFAAYDGSLDRGNGYSGREPWSSTGTTAGTVKVADINQWGDNGVFDNYMAAWGSSLCFVGYNYDYGDELWKSDGTAAGTVMIKDLTSGSTSTQFDEMKSGGAKFFFTASTDDGSNYYLYQTNGTDAGTQKVQIAAADVKATGLAGNSSGIFFNHVDSTPANKMYFTNGSASGYITHATDPATDYIVGMSNFTQVVNTATLVTLYFFTGVENNTGNPKLWRLSTTSSLKAVEIVDTLNASIENATNLTAVGATLYFIKDSKLWKVNSANKGEIVYQTGTVYSIMDGAGSLVFFTVETAPSTYQLYQSNGTTAGTASVKDSNNNGLFVQNANSGIGAGSNFYFNSKTHSTIWFTSGTGAKPLRDANSNLFSGVALLINVGSILYFQYDDGSGNELWESNGTPTGTKMSKDINPFGGINIDYGVVVGITLYMNLDDDIHGDELWKK